MTQHSEIPSEDHYYDGGFYRLFLDPGLSGIRRRLSKLVPQGSKVLDVGCGTGDQLFHLADQINYGLGVELSARMLRTALQRVNELEVNHIDFELADASQLGHLADQTFHICMSTMVIHEMPEAKRLPVLREMIRLGKKIILVDWICPQPKWGKRWTTHLIERIAGREHYAGYRSFMNTGGIPRLLEQASLKVLETQITSKGTIQLWICEHT